MISTVLCLNIFLNTEGRPINMERKENDCPNIAIEHQHESRNLRPASTRLQHESQNAGELHRAQGTSKKFEARNAFDTGTRKTPKTAGYDLSPKSSSTGKWIAGIIIAAVVAVGAWFGYDVYIAKRKQTGTIDSQTSTLPRETARTDYAKLSEEIFTSFENSFGDYVKAGAVEDYEFCANEDDLLRNWGGRNIFMLRDSRTGFIDTEKFSQAFTNALQSSTLEMNDEGTLFQADMSDAQSFSAKSLIESSVTPASSLEPDKSQMHSNTQAMKRRITGDITRQLETNGTNGYVRFILRTNNEGAKLMAAYSLNPSDALERKYLVLSDNFTGFDGRTRAIEDCINVMSDINVVSFTMKHGHVESNDSLAECLRKFAKSFAK